MRIQTDLLDTQVIDVIDRFVKITGEDPWSRKFEVLKLQLAENSLIGPWQADHHDIELKFLQLLERQQKEGVFPVEVEDHFHYQLYGFFSGVVRIYEQLSPFAQRRLRGMLLDGLKPDNNLLSVQHEVLTAVHLMSVGFDVEMNDLEHGSDVDFIARRDGLELEVECKMFSADLGRKLHRRKEMVPGNRTAG